MKPFLTVLAVAGAIVCGSQVAAHHSLAATYREDATVTIRGELVQFVYRNPHSLMHVIVQENSRAPVRYAVEWGSAGELVAQGVTRETLKPGDFVVITGSPSRAPSDHRIRVTALERPSDGFVWEPPPGEPSERLFAPVRLR
jgi:hypothetical protein